MPIEPLTKRIEELEMKLTFQDQTIEELNLALIQQQNDFRKMARMLENVASQVDTISQNGQGNQETDPPPPHY